MTTLDELRAQSKPESGCSVGKFMRTLSDEDQATARAAFADPPDQIRTKVIHAWLKGLGFDKTNDTVEKHRFGRCSCE